MQFASRMKAIIGVWVILILVGGGISKAHAFTLEEVADLREMMNEQLGLKGKLFEMTRKRSQFSGLLFINNKRGWVTTATARSARTEDGGLHWKVSNDHMWKDEPWTPWGSHVTSPRKGIPMGGFFVNAQKGWWRHFDVLFRTHDEGKSWGKLKLPRSIIEKGGWDFRTIWFANEREGWIYTHGGFVFRTKDGGDTWDEGTQLLDKQWAFGSMRFLNSRTGYIVGSYAKTIITPLPGGGNKGETKWIDGMIFYTHDGGETWKRPETSLRVLPPNGIRMNDVAIMSEKEAWVVGSMGKRGWNGTIWRTTDGGAHWEVVVTDVPEYFRSAVIVEQEAKPTLLISSQAGKVYRMKLTE